MQQERYPDAQMSFAPLVPLEWQLFAELREELLLDYGYNTARAYWADLQSWFEWAVSREKDVLGVTVPDVGEYVALLRRRHYSESTIRRQLVSLRKLRLVTEKRGVETSSS